MREQDIEIPIPATVTRPPMKLKAPYGEPDDPDHGDLWHDGETIYTFLNGEKHSVGPVD